MTNQIIKDFCNCLLEATSKYCARWRVVEYERFQDHFIDKVQKANDWSEFEDEVMHPCWRLGLVGRELAIKGFYRTFLGSGPQDSFGDFKIAFIRTYRDVLKKQLMAKRISHK